MRDYQDKTLKAYQVRLGAGFCLVVKAGSPEDALASWWAQAQEEYFHPTVSEYKGPAV